MNPTGTHTTDLPRAVLEGGRLFDRTLSSHSPTRLKERYDTGERGFDSMYLENRDLAGMVFQHADFSGALLGRASLVGTDFSETCLRGADFTRVRAQRVVLRHACCAGATFSSAQCAHARAEGVDLTGVVGEESLWREAFLEGCNASSANFQNACLMRACLRRSVWTDADLTRADLRGADLRGSDLSRANLERSDLRGADLREACLDGVQWVGMRYDRHTKWPEGFDPTEVCGFGPGTVLDRAKLLGASLVGYHLARAQLNHADLRGIRFHWTNLRGASLRGADLRGAKLVRCNARYADLRGACVVNADLSGADFHRAQLEGAEFEGSFYSRKTCWPKGFSYRTVGAIGPKSEHQGERFERMDWCGRDLYAASLQEIRVVRGLMRWAFFGYANLTGALLVRSDALLANFESSVMCGVNWTRSRLHEANLARVDARGGNFSFTDLRLADLRGANLVGCDFTGAVLTGALFDHLTRWDADFDPERFGMVCVDEADEEGWSVGFRHADSIA